MNHRAPIWVPVLCFFLPGAALAAPSASILVELAAFPSANDSAAIEVYTLLSKPKGSRGGETWLLALNLRDDHGHALGEASRVLADVGEETGAVAVWHFRAGAGDLRVRVRAEDLETGDRTDREATLRVPDFRREFPRVSTPVFGVLPGESGSVPPGIRGRRGILPIQAHRVTSTADTVAVLLTIEDGQTVPGVPGKALPDSFQARAVLARRSRVEWDQTFRFPRPRSEWLLRQPALGLAGGDYKLQLTVALGGEEVRREVEFRIAPGGSDFLADPLRLRTVLAYVATREERMALEAAEGDSLVGLWTRFWARRDPSPNTEKNEARDLFVERVETASQRFGGVVPGWRTDQGRIFILHGHPDRVDRVPAHGSQPATETWIYGKVGASYVFEDLDGFGTLRLTGGHRD